jgi:hypothetical protein
MSKDIHSSDQRVDEEHFKDEALDRLAGFANVAQFVSFGPGEPPVQRFFHAVGALPNQRFDSPLLAIEELLRRSASGAVSIRRFLPSRPQGWELILGCRDARIVLATVEAIAREGLFAIVNETIPLDDGGVAGVVQGDLMEFAPGDTPRCVEGPGTVRIERSTGIKLLACVYHFSPALVFPGEYRVEFSLHPIPLGIRNEHTIIWEVQKLDGCVGATTPQWPNKFSELIGDKTFGLMVAHLNGLLVPATTVIARRIAPFCFGMKTGTGEYWIRTSPKVQAPGKYPTFRGWRDPFELMRHEDRDGEGLAAVLAQEGVKAEFSGALITSPDGQVILEGVRGQGDDFMLGRVGKDPLPEGVVQAVMESYSGALERLDAVRLEWVHDGERSWIVQLHRGATQSSGFTVVPGKVARYRSFDVRRGIAALRSLIEKLRDVDEGIELIGDIGITSHMGDLLRRAGKPSRVRPRAAQVAEDRRRETLLGA